MVRYVLPDVGAMDLPPGLHYPPQYGKLAAALESRDVRYVFQRMCDVRCQPSHQHIHRTAAVRRMCRRGVGAVLVVSVVCEDLGRECVYGDDDGGFVVGSDWVESNDWDHWDWRWD